jgi:hypothetical protein
MGSFKMQKAAGLILGTILVAAGFVQCTKENPNASQIARALVEQPDTTVYSSFYDTVVIDKHSATPDVNDVISTEGVRSIVRSNCSSSSCHGGNFSPKLTDYADIKALVTPGNPEGSLLFQLITTSDVNKAMPPVNYGVDLSVTDKTKIYNWIKNGANERPTYVDLRPAAISLLTNGCASGNCHNEATATGYWARKGLIPVTAGDTAIFSYYNPGTGTTTIYPQMKDPLMTQVWTAYKDSVKKFYADTLANASFRPYKTFATPVSFTSHRGPLNTYDDILMDIAYPKSARSNGTVQYTDPVTLKKYYAKGDYLNVTSSLVSRIDSTLLLANPRTKVFATNHQGDMAYGDGGLKSSEIALIKAWYFNDPNIPDVWKYGTDGSGIFKYRKTGTIITK